MKTCDKITAYQDKHPEATFREIMEAVGLKSTSTVAYHLDRKKTPPMRIRIQTLHRENTKFRKALQRISLGDGDVVDIARQALGMESQVGT
jgi:SOS-response transcriptional repressor LexA